jgi:hypothetical protein
MGFALAPKGPVITPPMSSIIMFLLSLPSTLPEAWVPL